MTITVLPGTVHHQENFSLDQEGLDALWRSEDQHFWFRARNRWILRALGGYGLLAPAKILEVGCGSGTVARGLVDAGYQVTGIDTAEVQVRKAHERCPSASFVVGDVAALDPTEHGPFDAVGFFDVLEHLDDPEALVRASLRLCRPGALVAATVPALGSLHTVIDDISGHKRRYEPSQLAALCARCGLVRVTEHGIFRCFTPLLRMFRRRWTGIRVEDLDANARREISVLGLRVPSGPVNLAMELLARTEESLGFRWSAGATGASLLAVAFMPPR